MKAMVYTAPLEMQILEVDEPEPGPGEILVAVGAVGICGSELEGFISKSPFRVPPLIMGHEFAGHRVDDGTPVVVNPIVSCWECDLCLRGLPNVCRRRAIVGVQRPGAFAELVSVPARNCYPLAPGASIALAAAVEPLANAAHAVRLVQEHDPVLGRVGVIGAGPLGFFTALVSADRGVSEVVIADLAPARRAMARATGAVVAESLEGEFDAIFDAYGSAATRRASVDLLRPGGTAVWIGLHGSDTGVDGLGVIRQEKRILGTFAYEDQDFRAAISRVATLSGEWLASRPLDEGVETFYALAHGDVSSVKTLLVP
jgi:threonine dehydrogenase-like Zn-dependent dehydrogenase